MIIVDHKTCSDRLLILPKVHKSVSVDFETIEELNETKCMLTYEVSKQQNIKAINSSHTVILKGTKYTYPFVMNYPMTKGGFFTKNAVENESKYAVMNELAAFEIFGDYNIIGNKIVINHDSYIVVGIIDDGDKSNKNVYLPVTFFTNSPDTFIVKMDSPNNISDEFIESVFKQVGITSSNYDFINIGMVYSMIGEKVLVSFELVLMDILYLIIKRGIRVLFHQYNMIMKLLDQYYFIDFLKKGLNDFIVFVSAVIDFFISAGAIIWVTMQWVKSFLKWRQVKDMLQFEASGNFNDIVYSLKNMTIYSDVFVSCFYSSNFSFYINYRIFELSKDYRNRLGLTCIN